MDIPRPFMKRLARPEGHGRLPIDLHQDGTLQYVHEHVGIMPMRQGGAARQVRHGQYDHLFPWNIRQILGQQRLRGASVFVRPGRVRGSAGAAQPASQEGA